jgi:predicted Zn-dependent protease
VFVQAGWLLTCDATAGSPVAVSRTALSGADPAGTGRQGDLARLVEQARIDAADCSADTAEDVMRALAATVLAWPTESRFVTRLYLTWCRTTNGWFTEDTCGLTRRQYCRATVVVHDPVVDVVGKAGVYLQDGLTAVQLATLREAHDRAVAQATRLACGAPLPGGAERFVLGPAAAGVFAHEAVGHLCEADNARGPLRLRLGQRLTDAPLRAVDGPQQVGAWGEVEIDDEGSRTALTAVVDGGLLHEYLTDEATAATGGSNGHGLRASFRDPVCPRLTQVGIAAGPHSAADLIASARTGVYVDSIGFGYLNPTSGRVKLVFREARLIDGGTLSDTVIRGGTVEWNVYDALRAIVGIGDEQVWTPSLCLKRHQKRPVLNGGVPLLLELPSPALR